jgi:hypothetical protein
MSNVYNLVHPYILGSLETSVKANNSNEAARQIYSNLSEHFNNSIPTFFFSLQKGQSGGGKYYHFVVNEKRENNEVSYAIKNYNVMDKDLEEFKLAQSDFISKYENIKGGKDKKKKKSKSHKKKKHHKHDDEEDSSSSSSSSSDEDIFITDTENIYRRVRRYIIEDDPISFWWCRPSLYGKYIDPFIPTFYSVNKPHIQISIRGYISDP